MVKGYLYVLGQGAAHPLQIHFLGVQAAGLDEQLVPGLIREAHHLVLNAGAVPGADALNLPAIQGRAVDVLQNHLLGFVVGPADMAHSLVLQGFLGVVGEGHNGLVSLLDFQVGEVDGGSQHPGGGACLKPPQGDTQLFQGVRQERRREHAVGTALVGHVPHKHLAPQESPRGDNDGLGPVHRLQPGGEQPLLPRLLQLDDFPLPQQQVGAGLQLVLHQAGVVVPVNLGPQGVYRRALAQVEHPALDGAGVGGAAHLPAQGVDFPDKVALGRAANAGVAGAVAHGVQVDGKDNSRAPQPCGGQGGLYAGVPRADNGNIKGTSVVSHRNLQKEKIKGEANIKFLFKLFSKSLRGIGGRAPKVLKHRNAVQRENQGCGRMRR